MSFSGNRDHVYYGTKEWGQIEFDHTLPESRLLKSEEK